jgi:threonine synthase
MPPLMQSSITDAGIADMITSVVVTGHVLADAATAAAIAGAVIAAASGSLPPSQAQCSLRRHR